MRLVGAGRSTYILDVDDGTVIALALFAMTLGAMLILGLPRFVIALLGWFFAGLPNVEIELRVRVEEER